MGNRGATRLALAMRKEACVLTSLDLSDNIVGDEGAQALAAALCTAARLTRLDLACNLVGDAGATALAAALGTLTSLDLRNNPRVTAAGKAALAAALCTGVRADAVW